MTLGEKILSLRTARDMSQDDLAEQLEVSRQSVSKWETGQSTPDLDKIIRLADLFGVSVDELVREEERPQPPEPPQPQVVYVEREKRELTVTQKTGITFVIAGAVSVIMGFMGADLLGFLGLALIILSLPLILAKKHPFIIMGWLAVVLSLLILNPYFSVSPWGLIGGLHYLRYLIVKPEARYLTFYAAAAVGIGRGLLILTLIFCTWRAWKDGKRRSNL